MKHNGTQKIETSRLLLRPFKTIDFDYAFNNWLSNPNIQIEYGEPVYSTIQEVSQLISGWIDNYANKDFYRWAIIEKASNQNIGQIAFCKVYSECYTAEIEYCIGEDFWGKGYAGEALNSVIEYTFKNTGFKKLEAFHREANVKSGRVLEKSNMKVTGNIERFKKENIVPYGEICYSITNEEYLLL